MFVLLTAAARTALVAANPSLRIQSAAIVGIGSAEASEVLVLRLLRLAPAEPADSGAGDLSSTYDSKPTARTVPAATQRLAPREGAEKKATPVAASVTVA